MKKNFVFVVAILAMTAFTIGVVSITQQVSAQTVPEGDKPKEPAPEDSKDDEKPGVTDEMLEKVEKEFDKAIEEFEKGEHVEKPAFAELGIPEWWMNPPEFENHIVFGRGYAMFVDLESFQDAKDTAEFNAMYEINAKLIGKMDSRKDKTDFGYHSSDYLKALNVRIFNAEIVKHDGRYAYFVMMTCSLYNKALEDMDPDDVNKVRETLDLMQEHGAFNREKRNIHELEELFRESTTKKHVEMDENKPSK